MALSSCFASPHRSFKTDNWSQGLRWNPHGFVFDQCLRLPVQGRLTEPVLGQQICEAKTRLGSGWSCLGGQRITLRPKPGRILHSKRSFRIHCSWQVGSHLASTAFTIGTAAVLPFYTLMVAAPKSELTKKAMGSSIPYVILGILYAYLLYQSWTPETIRLMFASKYWLPELSGIAKMFSSEMTLASAWIHLLVIDLFAARQIYHEGLENELETRHSVSLCLLFCPVGILAHVVTKALKQTS